VKVKHILVPLWSFQLENLEINGALVHLMLLSFDHHDAVQHVHTDRQLLDEQKGLDDHVIRVIDDCKYESHYAHHIAILPRPKPGLTVEVPLKIELLTNLLHVAILIAVSDPFIEKPFKNL